MQKLLVAVLSAALTVNSRYLQSTALEAYLGLMPVWAQLNLRYK
jgi:hypothetical protein